MIEHFMANREQRFLMTWSKWRTMAKYNYTEVERMRLHRRRHFLKEEVMNPPVSLSGKHSSVSCLYVLSFLEFHTYGII